MPQELDLAAATQKMSILETHFAGLRRYLLPPYLPANEKVWRRTDSQLSDDMLQSIGDEMRAYLGLSQFVRVRVVNGGFGLRDDGRRVAGMQASPDPLKGEVVLSRCSHFENIHLLAILAHEMTHAFLRYHNLVDGNESQNELLTEAGAVYLGFGLLLRDGYAPFSWKEEGPPAPLLFNWVFTNTEFIGYIDVSSVILLLGLSSRCAGCHYPRNSTIRPSSGFAGSARRVAWPRILVDSWRDKSNSRFLDVIDRELQEATILGERLERCFAAPSFPQSMQEHDKPEWPEVRRVYESWVSGQLQNNLRILRVGLSELESNQQWDKQKTIAIRQKVKEILTSLRHTCRELDR